MDWTLCLALIIALVAIVLLALLVYSGLLAEISVKACPSPYGELEVLYTEHIGPYSQVGSVFMSTCELAPSLKTIGIYLDDPKETPAECCRSAVGVIINDADAAVVKRLTDKGYKRISLPKVDNVVYTSFPFINTISIYISVWRVYPQMERYILENGLTAMPFLEVYDADQIIFFSPLSRYEEFTPDIKAPKIEPKVEPKIKADFDPEPESIISPIIEPVVESALDIKAESEVYDTNTNAEYDDDVDQKEQQQLSSEPAQSARTAELIRDAVSDESSVPAHSDSPQEVQTQFTNRDDLEEAIADPAEQQKQQPNLEQEEEDDNEMEDFEDRLRKLEQDISDKHSRVRDNVALAEIEEHLKKNQPPAELEESATLIPESQQQQQQQQEAENFTDQLQSDIVKEVSQSEQQEVQSEQLEPQVEQQEAQIEQEQVKSEQQEVQSEQPEVQSEQPEVQSEQPEVQNEQPEVQSEQQELQSEQPEVQSEQPEVQSEQQEVQSEQQEVQSEQPEGQSEQPDQNSSHQEHSVEAEETAATNMNATKNDNVDSNEVKEFVQSVVDNAKQIYADDDAADKQQQQQQPAASEGDNHNNAVDQQQQQQQISHDAGQDASN